MTFPAARWQRAGGCIIHRQGGKPAGNPVDNDEGSAQSRKGQAVGSCRIDTVKIQAKRPLSEIDKKSGQAYFFCISIQ